MSDRIVDPDKKNFDNSVEKNLRPKYLDEFIGQKDLRKKLKIYIEAAKKRNEPIDHILFHGPPGLGKTTLAHIIAHEMGVNIKITSGPILTKPGDVAAILTNLEHNDVLFIDEVHRLNRSVEEMLYSAMEDFELDIIIGEGPSAKNIRIPLESFTLIGATTRAGLLTSPLRDRFGVLERLEFYNIRELKKIIRRSAKILNVKIDDKSANEIAKRSRYTPRVANRLLKRVRDFADVKNNGVIDENIIMQSFELLKIDEKGLDKMDKKILKALINRFEGGPAGLDSLSVVLGEEKDTIEDVYEPFLVRAGFIERTSRGRIASKKTYRYFDINKTENQENSSFNFDNEG
ncbi:MAG: Holliday junction branch migration DNA helicase RuvB [Candidatus Mcinerneyibacterium aminivorans]|jgi:Holliday junction DNA helicase RuvB|uniref:Holliday junction branch migration complex subunit RuvB n=1 Tax=Candidatus Mcinerneyibacterium aminivorans TaxID=2703815 RepID=A0A5D0MC90_9BACT|nr:MAG: Holliday junction branch migration DNA helicase RuvB [Candidatus Mcinerneyibacterium aminivorans]